MQCWCRIFYCQYLITTVFKVFDQFSTANSSTVLLKYNVSADHYPFILVFYEVKVVINDINEATVI